jgi:hypothetical protein
MAEGRRYHYVGPAEIREAVRGHPAGTIVRSREDLLAQAPAGAVLTYVVGLDGWLRVADRRSEHVACAAAEPVLAAGELEVDARGEVVETSNQSTGYCPEPSCWSALAAALDRAGVVHPGAFTRAFEFRRCEACGERNLVKDRWFVCSMCDAELPATWNFAEDDE